MKKEGVLNVFHEYGDLIGSLKSIFRDTHKIFGYVDFLLREQLHHGKVIPWPTGI